MQHIGRRIAWLAAPAPAVTLAVDDHADSVSWLSRAVRLAFPDTALMTAGSLASARAAVQRGMPALVLVDRDLPDGSGVTLNDQWSRRGSQHRPSIRPVLIVTTEATRRGPIQP